MTTSTSALARTGDVVEVVIRIRRMTERSACGILPVTPMPSTRCPNCCAVTPDGARFCPSCGRPLGVGDAAERKLATVLFADLAGSTELATSMDAETLRGLLGDLYDQLSRAAEAYGGTVEKFIGDAVMAVFGVPTAHEDDPERAVRAAIVMRSRLAGLAERRDMRMDLRIGINTGLVVTGTSPGRDFLVTGEAVNLAARLQQAAEPGEILVGERTFRAVEPLARTVAPRSLRVKGRAGPDHGLRRRADGAGRVVPPSPARVRPVRRPRGRADAAALAGRARGRARRARTWSRSWASPGSARAACSRRSWSSCAAPTSRRPCGWAGACPTARRAPTRRCATCSCGRRRCARRTRPTRPSPGSWATCTRSSPTRPGSGSTSCCARCPTGAGPTASPTSSSATPRAGATPGASSCSRCRGASRRCS